MEINLLIVDDEVFSVDTLKEQINWKQYDIQQVYGAYSAQEARKLMLEQNITLVLCDIEMPGESGLELIEWVREGTRLQGLIMEFIILTCHPEYEFMRKAMQIGCSDYLLKPIDYDELDTVLRKAIKNIREKESEFMRLATVENLVSENEKSDLVQEKIIPYIMENLTQSFTIADLAKYVALNPQYMMRLFKKNTGQSIVEYVTTQKMLLAKELLSKTEWNNEIIAEKVGYISTTYFIKIFKKLSGMTPREYRKTLSK